MGRVKTYTNDDGTGLLSAKLLPTDLNAIQDDYELGFASYRVLEEGATRLDAAAAGTYVMRGSTGNANELATAAGAGLAVFYLDPADYAAGARAVKYRLNALCLTNAVAPAVTLTVGLYPVTAVAGGAAAVTITLGAVQAGSTVAFVTPALSTRSQGSSGDFTAPAAGYYALGVVNSGAMVASSAVAVRGRLQLRQV